VAFFTGGCVSTVEKSVRAPPIALEKKYWKLCQIVTERLPLDLLLVSEINEKVHAFFFIRKSVVSSS
jgi:hypothetical protein